MKNYQKTQNLGLQFQQEIKQITKDNSYFLLRYTLKNKEKGSLFIRIFIYLIIFGILAPIAYFLFYFLFDSIFGPSPTCAKGGDGARAVETLNLYQQGYHFENQKFASNLRELGIVLPKCKYYNFLLHVTPEVSYAVSFPTNDQKYQVFSYSGAIFFEEKTKSYQQIICRTNERAEKPTKPIFKKGILTCPNNMTKFSEIFFK